MYIKPKTQEPVSLGNIANYRVISCRKKKEGVYEMTVQRIERKVSIMDLQKYNKALVPLVVTIALAGLSQLGITSDMKIEDVVTLIMTSGLVWLIPNKES